MELTHMIQKLDPPCAPTRMTDTLMCVTLLLEDL